MPVLLVGDLIRERGKPDVVSGPAVFDIEKGSMPLLARIDTSNPRKDGIPPGRDAGSAAPSRLLLGTGSFRLGNDLNFEAKRLGPQKNCRPNSKIGLASRDEARERANC